MASLFQVDKGDCCCIAAPVLQQIWIHRGDEMGDIGMEVEEKGILEVLGDRDRHEEDREGRKPTI